MIRGKYYSYTCWSDFGRGVARGLSRFNVKSFSIYVLPCGDMYVYATVE